MKIKKIFLNMSISKKLIISYIVTVAVPLIICSFVIFKNFKSKAIDTRLQEDRYQLQEEDSNIQNNINAMEMTAENIVSDKKLIDFIKTDTEISNEGFINYSQNIATDIQTLQSNNPSINRIKFFISKNDFIPDIWPYIYHENSIINNNWFKTVLNYKGKEYWIIKNTDITSDGVRNDNNDVVSLYRAVNIPSDNHLGTVEVNMLSSDFFRKVFNETENKESQFMVIDDLGNVIANDNFFKENNISYDYIKKSFYKNLKNKKSGNFIISKDNKTLMISYQYIDIIKSYMLNVDSYKSILKSIAVSRITFISYTIILLVILSFVIYFITSYILKDLRTITKELKKMRKGDFNINLPITSNDEVGELAYHFRDFSQKINELVSDKIERETIVKEAELRALKSQIDAHFLYNVLENIKMMAEIDEKYDVSDAITSLGNMMRYNMEWNSQFVTFEKEIDYVKDYVALMNMRFNNNIKLELNIDNEVLGCKILKMTLQPIVENSIKHGLKKKILENSVGRVIINACIKNDNIECEIIDDGIGISEEDLSDLREKLKVPDIKLEDYLNKSKCPDINTKSSKNGIGLKNVYERVKLFLGDDYEISIYSKLDEYTKVILKLPINK